MPVLAQYKSPTGAEIKGTYERITGCARIAGINPETGEPEFDGGTEIFWDEQRTIERDGKTIYLDTQGDEWTFDQLTRIEDEVDAEVAA